MKIFDRIKDKIIILSFVVFIAGSIYLFLSTFTYIDPINFCYIDIEEDILRGNKKTVFEAIDKIKKEDLETYKILCSNVDMISENFCEGGDPRIDNSINIWNNEACYIRGSKTIYLKPKKKDDDAIIYNRAEMLKKYSVLSQKFWDNVNK